MNKTDEKKLIKKIKSLSLKAASGGLASLVTVKDATKLCREWKLTPLELSLAAGEFVEKEKNRLRILYRNPDAIISLLMILELHKGVKQSFDTADAKIWRRKYFKFIPKNLQEATWRKLVNQIKQDLGLTRAGDYRKAKFIE